MMGRDNYGAKGRLAGVSLPESEVSLDTAETTDILKPGGEGRARRHPKEGAARLVVM